MCMGGGLCDSRGWVGWLVWACWSGVGQFWYFQNFITFLLIIDDVTRFG